MPKLSSLVLQGIGDAYLHFGARGEAISSAELLEGAQAHYSDSASSDSIAMLMTNDRPTVELILGAIAAGSRLISLPLPARTTNPDDYVALLRSACQQEHASTIVASDEIATLLRAQGLEVYGHADLCSIPLAARCERGFELIQFSSGSTGSPKGIRLDDDALGANVAAIIATIQPRPGDLSLSWLPLSHDMGLIGMLLTSLASAVPELAGTPDIVILDPVSFLRAPSSWLNAISSWSATITAAPDFAFRLASQRTTADSLDLSQLRCATVGGETVRLSTLDTFTSHFGPAGFQPTAFCPAYGMAEVALAVTMTPPEAEWRSIEVTSVALAERELVPATLAPEQGPRITLVSSGPPIAGYEVRVQAPPDRIGTIEVRGPSVGVNATNGNLLSGPDGWFRTDDVGTVIDGWIYVSGRDDDHVVTNGRNIHAPTVETAVGSVDGIRSGRTAVIGLPSGEWIVAAELEAREPLAKSDARALKRQVRRAVVNAAGSGSDQVVLIDRGRMPVTTSGKLQRREALRRYLTGEL